MKGHAGGGLPASQKADFFFDRNVHGERAVLPFRPVMGTTLRGLRMPDSRLM